MAKAELAICAYKRGETPQVLEEASDRGKGNAALKRYRDALPESEKGTVILLPLDKKGNPLLPPGS